MRNVEISLATKFITCLKMAQAIENQLNKRTSKARRAEKTSIKNEATANAPKTAERISFLAFKCKPPTLQIGDIEVEQAWEAWAAQHREHAL